MSWFFKKKDKKDNESKDNPDISPREDYSKSKPKALDPK